MGELVVGVDLGTQGVRAVVSDLGGHVLGQGHAPLTSNRNARTRKRFFGRDGDRHEQDAERWWQAVGTAVHTALDAAPDRPVLGVATCATSGTVVLTDDALRPKLPALMYDDLRARDHRVLDKIDPAVWDRLGVRPQPSWALGRIAWLRDQEPDGLVLHQADFVTGRLAGHAVAADTSHALKSGADPVTRSWPEEIRAELGPLPELARPGAVLGEVCATAAEHTGLPLGTPIIAGMTDGCAAQLATGALEVGSWNSVLGTTLVVKGVTERRITDPDGSVYSHLSPDGHWWPGGASSIGAGVLGSAFPGRDLAELDAAAPLREALGCVSYPLAGRGERFPFVRPDAEGFTLGEPRDELERYAATLQGVAFVERLCFEHVAGLGAPVGDTIRVTGGAVRSAAWTQLRADVLGRALELPEVAQPAFGMAVLAAASTSGRTTADAAREMVRVARVFEPDARVGAALEPGYQRLRRSLLDD
ncbi:FGGY-family carbohydrate kinase [Allokutzneria albata]|uniref:Xylulokinase n=1 Tax=Allokutzneria albata TaxID=211114 RepID=A0A1G9UPZ8_ALLAB|nr:FGGY-family carbohydrate kinase [Allokutzneria albata]SDM61960.1 xylulokinase [Allokutzneria albata]